MTKTAKPAFDPRPGETFWEENFFPVETDYWEEARRFAQDAEDFALNADLALGDVRATFFEGDGTAEAVRIAELEKEKADHLYEISKEPLQWLDARRAQDDYSRKQHGVPHAIWEKRTRLGHVERSLGESRSNEAARRGQDALGAHNDNIARLKSWYENKVIELEGKVLKGKLTQAQAQAQADEEAKIRDEEIAAQEASWRADVHKSGERLEALKAEAAALRAWLNVHDLTATKPKLNRK